MFVVVVVVVFAVVAYVREPNLRLYVINTFAVTQQISAVTLFLAVFMHIQDGLISVGTMVGGWVGGSIGWWVDRVDNQYVFFTPELISTVKASM